MNSFNDLIRSLDFQSLAALCAVEHQGSFTAAGAFLNISQPAVSQLIKRLEENVGFPLVVRNRKKAVLTNEGRRLAQSAEHASDSIEEALANIHQSQKTPRGRVLLGCHSSLAAYALPAFMASFLKRYPEVTLSLVNATSDHIEERMISGSIDLGLVVNPTEHPDTIVKQLFKDSVELVHALPKDVCAPSSTLLERVPLLYVPELTQSKDILRRIAKKKIKIKRTLPCSSLDLVKQFVLDRVGVGILPMRVAQFRTQKKIKSLGPSFPAYKDSVALVRRYDVPLNAATRAVVEQLIEHC